MHWILIKEIKVINENPRTSPEPNTKMLLWILDTYSVLTFVVYEIIIMTKEII